MLDFNVRMSKTEVKLHIKNKCQEEWDREVRATYYYNIQKKEGDFIICHRINKNKRMLYHG